MKTITVRGAVQSGHGVAEDDIIRVKCEAAGTHIVTAVTEKEITIRRLGWLERIGMWASENTPAPNWLIWLLGVAAFFNAARWLLS